VDREQRDRVLGEAGAAREPVLVRQFAGAEGVGEVGRRALELVGCVGERGDGLQFLHVLRGRVRLRACAFLEAPEVVERAPGRVDRAAGAPLPADDSERLEEPLEAAVVVERAVHRPLDPAEAAQVERVRAEEGGGEDGERALLLLGRPLIG